MPLIIVTVQQDPRARLFRGKNACAKYEIVTVRPMLPYRCSPKQNHISLKLSFVFNKHYQNTDSLKKAKCLSRRKPVSIRESISKEKECIVSPSVHYPTASLKPRREESLLNGHLWIFSGALQQRPHWIEPGGLVDVKSATGDFVARGYYNPNTDIAIRILTRDSGEEI